MVVLKPIFGSSTTCFYTEHMSALKCCACNLVLLHDDVIHQRDRYAGICDTCTAVQYHGSAPPYMVMLM